MLTKDQKRAQSDALAETLKGVNTLFLLKNTGLKVNEVNELRDIVRNNDAIYKVVKHSVVRLAIEGTNKECLGPHLRGPLSLAYTPGDCVALAKVLKDFIKKHPSLSFQEAYLEGEILDAKAAASLAEMASREELISKLLFLLQSPIRRLAVALNGPIQNIASVLSQVADKKES